MAANSESVPSPGPNNSDFSEFIACQSENKALKEHSNPKELEPGGYSPKNAPVGRKLPIEGMCLLLFTKS